MVRILILTLALLSGARPVWAHAFLAGASPPVGSQLPAAPPNLILRFTEAVEPLFCTVELRDEGNATMALDAPRVADGNAQALVMALPRLRAGTYTVIWHATSVDTHKTEGRFQFTIGP
jgi:methionine-rich copper-binding protein CopC